MKLYDSFRAPNPRRVRWAMAEKNITDIEVVVLDVFKGEHKTAWQSTWWQREAWRGKAMP